MKSYCDKSTAKRGFIRMGGDDAQFEMCAKEVDGKWLVDGSALPKCAGCYKKVAIRRRLPHFPLCNLPHKTGAELIAHIKAFDKSRNLCPGSLYIIGRQEVRV